jgi:hypothetical protein
MKYLPLFILLGALLSAGTAAAQRVAVKAGVNIASLSEDKYFDDIDDIEEQSIYGFQAGLVFDLGISDVFTIQPELLFIQKGGKFTAGIDENNQFEGRVYYNFIEIPLLAKLQFNSDPGGEGVGFYLIGGPFGGFALNGRTETETTILGQTTTLENDINYDDEDADDYQKRIDYGIVFGGGLVLGNIFLDARYNLGLNNLLDEDTDNNNDENRFLRTRGIGVTLGYMF